MGLLDFSDPQVMQGISLLAAAGPSMQPQNLGSRFGQAAETYQGLLGNQMKTRAADMQYQTSALALDKAKREAASHQALLGMQSQFFRPATPATPGTAAVNDALPSEFQVGAQAPMPAMGPQFDVKGYTAAALQKGYMDPIEAIKLNQALTKDIPINKLDVRDFDPASVEKFKKSGSYSDLVRMDKLHFADTGGSVVGLNQFTGAKVGSLEKTGNPFTDLVLSDGQGGFRPNLPVIGAKQSIAKSGAANTSVKIENKMGEGVAAQVGPMLKESYTAANGAVQQIDAANRIVAAVDTGKLFAGPGANARLKVAQVSQVLGVGGRDEAEKIYNTRQAVRGLAEMTLQGRKQMSGQGAITNQESALAERAMSGDISDLTVSEIKQLAQASSRAARFVYDQHQTMVGNLSADANTAGLAKFYKPMPMPTSVVQMPAAPTHIDSLIEKYAR